MAVLATTLVVAAAVQGLVGLGLALVAAPAVTLLEPRLMPDSCSCSDRPADV